MKPKFTHNVLPKGAQDLLKQAATIKGMYGRIEAIDAATDVIRKIYPDLFRPVELITQGE